MRSSRWILRLGCLLHEDSFLLRGDGISTGDQWRDALSITLPYGGQRTRDCRALPHRPSRRWWSPPPFPPPGGPPLPQGGGPPPPGGPRLPQCGGPPPPPSDNPQGGF